MWQQVDPRLHHTTSRANASRDSPSSPKDEEGYIAQASQHPLRDLQACDRPGLSAWGQSDPRSDAAKGLPAGETSAYPLDEIRQLLGAITDEVTRLLIALAGYEGLSKSELAGLMWETYEVADGAIKVTSGVVNGKRGDTKTTARNASVPLIPAVREMLDLYRLRMADPETGALPTTGVMFPSEAGTPLDLKNVYARRIDPILNACAECGEIKKRHRLADHEYRRRDDMVVWRGWHALRRGLGSNLHDLGVPDLTIQKILRHSNVTTTRKSYIHQREHQVTAAMGQLPQG